MADRTEDGLHFDVPTQNAILSVALGLYCNRPEVSPLAEAAECCAPREPISLLQSVALLALAIV
jgi:hypothetical protein